MATVIPQKMEVSAKDCLRENTRDFEQQYSRIMRRWRNAPTEAFDDRDSNEARLVVTLGFLLSHLLKRAPDPSAHRYWIDGVDIIKDVGAGLNFDLFGTCIFLARGDASNCWIGPFRLRLQYSTDDLDTPNSAWLQFGATDTDGRILLAKPSSWRTWRTDAANQFTDWTDGDSSYYTEFEMNPYRKG